MSRTETLEHPVRRPPFGAPYVFVLAVVDGDAPEGLHRLARPLSSIGRVEGADVVVDDEEVSARHCEVRLDGPVCTITDLDSRNGTTVNGRRLRPGVAQRLRHLDEVVVGTTRWIVLHGKYRARRD